MVAKCQFLLILLSLWNLINVVPLKMSIIHPPILYMLCKGMYGSTYIQYGNPMYKNGTCLIPI